MHGHLLQILNRIFGEAQLFHHFMILVDKLDIFDFVFVHLFF